MSSPRYTLSRLSSLLQHRHIRTMATLDKSNINPNVLNAQYAVRGELAIRAEELRTQLKKSPEAKTDLGFDSVIHANIGNPQQLDQKPITFFRQVVSLCEYPDLLEPENRKATEQLFPADAIERAESLLSEIGSVGAYTQSQGIPQVRQHIADYITRRDSGCPEASPDDIFLVAGASAGVHLLCQLMIANPDIGIMIPIPQYPLYTAALALYNGAPIPYYLDEQSGWSTNVKTMEDAYSRAEEDGKKPTAMVIINPGNPTGGSLSKDSIKSVLEFCKSKGLVCMADEVYQSNVFPESPPFTSFRSVLLSTPELKDSVTLASLHSTSKGMIGECGQRGGYLELLNFSKDAREQLYKLASINLCSPVIGQILVDCMVNPPRQSSPSYQLFKDQQDHIFKTLYDRATNLHKTFSELEGIECQAPQGAMYLFPTIKLPDAAIEAAKQEGKSPDMFYCRALLEATGICVVPGSGFGQREGTFHFRTTFLAPGDFGARLKKFHEGFMKKYQS